MPHPYHPFVDALLGHLSALKDRPAHLFSTLAHAVGGAALAALIAQAAIRRAS